MVINCSLLVAQYNLEVPFKEFLSYSNFLLARVQMYSLQKARGRNPGVPRSAGKIAAYSLSS